MSVRDRIALLLARGAVAYLIETHAPHTANEADDHDHNHNHAKGKK